MLNLAWLNLVKVNPFTNVQFAEEMWNTASRAFLLLIHPPSNEAGDALEVGRRQSQASWPQMTKCYTLFSILPKV